MKVRTQKKVLGMILLSIAGEALNLALSWVITCGIIKLITLCFGWSFTWAIATGIWLIGLLIRTSIKPFVHIDMKGN